MKKASKWKLLADLNISVKTVQFLLSHGYDIKRIDKSVHTDEEVVALAKMENRVIVTFDNDFGRIYYFYHKKKFSVIVLRLDDQTADFVNGVLKAFLRSTKCHKVKNSLIILYKD